MRLESFFKTAQEFAEKLKKLGKLINAASNVKQHGIILPRSHHQTVSRFDHEEVGKTLQYCSLIQNMVPSRPITCCALYHNLNAERQSESEAKHLASLATSLPLLRCHLDVDETSNEWRNECVED